MVVAVFRSHTPLAPPARRLGYVAVVFVWHVAVLVLVLAVLAPVLDVHLGPALGALFELILGVS